MNSTDPQSGKTGEADKTDIRRYVSATWPETKQVERFGHSEVSFIADASPDRILNWHKQGLVPESRISQGRGNRRKYTLWQVAYLMGMRVLSDHGIPLERVKVFTEVMLVSLIFDGMKNLVGEDFNSSVSVPSLCIYTKQTKEGYTQWDSEHMWPAETLDSMRELSQGKKARFSSGLDVLEVRQAEACFLINCPGLAERLRDRTLWILENRKNPEFKQLLKRHADTFANRGKEPPVAPAPRPTGSEVDPQRARLKGRSR